MKFRLCLMIAGLALGACGDSGRIDLGVPRSKVLSDVTDEEARTICESVNPEDIEISLSREQECTVGAVFFSSTPADCEAARDACLAMPPDDRMPEPQDCSTADAEGWSGCGATVGEVEDCMNAMLDRTESYLKGLTCADAGSTTGPGIPSVCAPVQERCPELLEEFGTGL